MKAFVIQHEDGGIPDEPAVITDFHLAVETFWGLAKRHELLRGPDETEEDFENRYHKTENFRMIYVEGDEITVRMWTIEIGGLIEDETVTPPAAVAVAANDLVCDKLEEARRLRDYDCWKEHPEHPDELWVQEVLVGGTRHGYWDWVEDRITSGEFGDDAKEDTEDDVFIITT